MQYYGQGEEIHQRKEAATGVLLTNLGTPEAPTAAALRPYLRQFLSDPRVIELPKWQWWPILHGIILRVRPAKSAALYKSIWTDEGSPLLSITKQQSAKLQSMCNDQGKAVIVKFAMRYGQPSIESALKEFQTEGVKKVVVLPLYPHSAGATVGSTWDAVADAFKSFRWVPEVHFINTYHDAPAYIDALVASIKEAFEQQGEPDKLMFSYHGMPQRYFDNGDPYYCFCQKTSRLVTEALGLSKDKVLTCFQSRFGREPWLQPYTDKTLETLAEQGVKKVAVVCPGFSADCLETIEEIAEENMEIFTEAGGEGFHYIPALNVRDDHIKMMVSLIQPYLT